MKELLKKPNNIPASIMLTLLFMLFTFDFENSETLGIMLVIAFVEFILIFKICSYVLSYSLSKDIRVSFREVKFSRMFLYALPCFLIWGIYLIAFYPGGMTYDALFQWEQIKKLEFNDWHPAVHTLLLLGLSKIWNTPAVMCLFQIIILSLTFGYSMVSLEKKGINRTVLYIATVIFSISPVNGNMTVLFSKDVSYSIALMLFTTIMINVVVSKGAWFDEKKNLTLFAITSLAILFFRHNGKFCLVPTFILLFILYKQKIKRMVIPMCIVAAIYLCTVGPVYKALNVKPAYEGEAFSIPLNVVAAVIKYGGQLTPEQKTYASELMPMETWNKVYDPYLADPIKSNVNGKLMLNDKKKFLFFVLDISLTNPRQALKGYYSLAGITFRIPHVGSSYTFKPTTNIAKVEQFNYLGLDNYAVSPRLTAFMKKVVGLTYTANFKIIFWRPALPLYIVLFFSTIAVLRNGKSAAIPITIIILNLFTIMIAIPAQDFRYLYANFLVVLPVVIFSFISYSDRSNKTVVDN